MQRNREPAQTRAHSAPRTQTGASPSPAIPDTRLPNPLHAGQRRAVAQALANLVSELSEELRSGPPRAELIELGGDIAAWRARQQASVTHVRRLIEDVGADELAFSLAVHLRDLLETAFDHRLRGASAALEQGIEAAMPERLELVREASARRKAERGFEVVVVGAREAPLELPSFAYTDGLAAREHPELVMVGMPFEFAAALLDDLARAVLDGRRLGVGEDLDGHLSGGYKLRLRQCSPGLVAQLPAAGAGALQVLVPDNAGRFPGEPGVAPDYERFQRYPDHGEHGT
jgi:Domain of unknown function (DUF4262)